MCHSKHERFGRLKHSNLLSISMAQWLGWWIFQCCQCAGGSSKPLGETMLFHFLDYIYTYIWLYIHKYMYVCIIVGLIISVAIINLGSHCPELRNKSNKCYILQWHVFLNSISSYFRVYNVLDIWHRVPRGNLIVNFNTLFNPLRTDYRYDNY